jgi:hypothetical protein
VAVDAVVPMDIAGQYLVEGHVRRAPGVAGVIEITVEGLAEESPVPSVRLPASAGTFRLVMTAPASGSAKLRARSEGSGAEEQGAGLEAETTVVFQDSP